MELDRLQFELLPSEMTNRRLQRLLNLVYVNFYRKFDPRKDIFKYIQIQTVAGCNLSCLFCPANKTDELYGGIGKFHHPKMEMQIFDKIMDDLNDITFTGIIMLFLMSEPLLDDRIVELVSKAKSRNPQAQLQIDTNGFLLNKELIGRLFKSGLDHLIVNDYTEDHRMIRSIEIWRKSIPWKKCYLRRRSSKEKYDPTGDGIGNRAGNVPGFPTPNSPLKLFCDRPFRSMYIGYNGKFVLCCQDWRFDEILGDVAKESVMNVWEGAGYEEIRRRLLAQHRDRGICRKCDFSGIQPFISPPLRLIWRR